MVLMTSTDGALLHATSGYPPPTWGGQGERVLPQKPRPVLRSRVSLGGYGSANDPPPWLGWVWTPSRPKVWKAEAAQWTPHPPLSDRAEARSPTHVIKVLPSPGRVDFFEFPFHVDAFGIHEAWRAEEFRPCRGPWEPAVPAGGWGEGGKAAASAAPAP